MCAAQKAEHIYLCDFRPHILYYVLIMKYILCQKYGQTTNSPYARMFVRDGILRGTRSDYQVLSELGLRIATDPNAISVISVVTSNRDPFHTSEIWTRLPVNPQK